MRKTTYFILALLLAFSSLALYADESEYYYINVPILKVYTHRLGYMIIYKKGSMETREAYLPLEWFSPAGKAQLVAGRGPTYPYLSAYYKSGEFSHLRLYVQDNMHDPSWVVFDQGANVEEKFKNAETLDLEF